MDRLSTTNQYRYPSHIMEFIFLPGILQIDQLIGIHLHVLHTESVAEGGNVLMAKPEKFDFFGPG